MRYSDQYSKGKGTPDSGHGGGFSMLSVLPTVTMPRKLLSRKSYQRRSLKEEFRMHDIQGLKETTGIRASQRYFSFEISGGPERTEFCVFGGRNCLRPLSADTASQLDVLGHDCDTLGVDGTQVGVFEENNQVSLRCLLESHDGR